MSSIIAEAIEKYNPVKIVLLFSGGHDSMCSTHFAASYLKSIGRDFTVYHGNTGIGIRQTREYVYSVVKHFNWPFYEGFPKEGHTYEDLVKKWGFPGSTPQSHQIMYRRLKAYALHKFVTHECKSNPRARENVLLISGIRQSESKIRMGYKEYIQKQDSRIWCSPIFYWSETDCKKYMAEQSLPRNPVKDKICISGECLCGAFAGREEWSEIKSEFPEAAAEINRIHQIAIDHGKPWPWSSGPSEWTKHNPPGQLPLMFMCVGCEDKRINSTL
ncbi:phosphoadenosine phosphosulfate reductase family protein [Dyadobacter aurulentus]|uniref:phosphoadenosine phosphosulfate reductase family protein n=1 Tax=Dyadobacter sp. UC 10 TaxID=2605428 RepID=UPI0011F0EC14|nr:phosphoadenosine phosphosulfate reductase family protein [Dyadobacter sp. UC 10]KAA0992757.1 phosphoadenosine phosphosulfate reductase family protein [Dyadobacter sp. UC 10]